MKIFLISLFFSVSVMAQLQTSALGEHFYKVDPQSSFFEQNLVPPDPAPPVPATAPRKIMLTDIDPGIRAGTFIGLKRVGGHSFVPGGPDDATSDMKVIFVDQNGRYLRYGSRSVLFAPQAVYPVTNAFTIFSNDPDFFWEAEVPENAVAILCAANDSFYTDNSDGNNNYGVVVKYPVIRPDIYQVVKNPILFAPSTRVDLVAGKNADVVVELGPQIDITGSTIEWLGKTYTCNPGGNNPANSVHSCTSTVTSTDRTVAFQIDPVPSEASKLGESTMTLTIKTPKPNPPGGFEVLGTKQLNVNVRKTKPIKLGFVPISGCDGEVDKCFQGATTADALDMSKNGVSLMNAMYPVANDGIAIEILPAEALAFKFNIPVLTDIGFIFDFKALSKLRDKKYINKGITHIVGLTTQDYFVFRGEPLSGGYAKESNFFEIKNAAFTQRTYATLAHEIGHTFGLKHRCHGVIYGDPCSTEESTFDGYLNTELADTIWEKKSPQDQSYLTRGPIVNSKYGDVYPIYSLMRGDGNSGVENGEVPQWTSRQEYKELFNASLTSSRSPRSLRNILKLSGYIESAEFKITSAYFFREDADVANAGKYIAEVKDLNGNFVTEMHTNSFKLSNLESEIVEFYLDTNSNSEIVEIYKLNENDEKQKIGEYLISGEILEEEIKYLSQDFVKIDLNIFKNTLKTQIDSYKLLIRNKKIEEAKLVLTKKIKPYIEEYMKNRGSRGASLVPDRIAMLETLTTSVARISALSNTLTPTNPIFSLNSKGIVGNKSTIEISTLRNPSNKSQKIIYKSWIDGVENTVDNLNGKFVATSPFLSAGEHDWVVNAYLVDSKRYNSIEASIRSYSKELALLEVQLSEETDPSFIQQLQEKINQTNDLVLKLQIERNALLKEVGISNHLSFLI